MLAAIVNLSKYHHAHEEFYSQFPSQQAAEIRRASQVLRVLAERWAHVDASGPTPAEGEQAEVAQLRHDLKALAESFGRAGTLFSMNIESSADAAKPLIQKSPSTAVVSDRQKIIVNDWRAAYMGSMASRLIRRATDILDHVDFTPRSAKADERGRRYSPKYLSSASDLLDRAAKAADESAVLFHDNERRWLAFRQRVGEVAKRSRSHDEKGDDFGESSAMK